MQGKQERPNVLLLIADQWRGDCLGVDGHPDVKTPFLDSLANTGMRFDNAYSATPSCIAARASIFTGMCQAHHGRVGYQDGIPWRYAHTMPACFSRAGYQTHCVGKLHVHPLRNRIGFDSVDLHDGYLHHYQNENMPRYTHQLIADDYCHWLDGLGHKNLLDTGLECNGWPARPWIYEEALHPTHWVADHALDFLRRRDRDCPFFLTASFVRPHPPLDAPEAYFAAYRGMDLRPPIHGDDWSAPVGPTAYSALHGFPDATYARQAQEGYYACITQVDHQIGRILEVLRTDGQLANTIVLFVADHGELLGDHNLFRKALPYEGSARVPMLLAGPGIPSGQVRHEVMDLMDVMPTLLDAAGLSIPDTVDGQSALRLDDAARGWLHGEHAYGALSNHFIVTAQDKYIWFSQTGREQFFALSEDPFEQHDAIHDPQRQARIRMLRETLIETLSPREEGYSDGAALVVGQAPRSILSFLQAE